jgi:hypothetical protein
MSRDVRMSELMVSNPTLEQQMRDWQTERHHRGENAFDWQAFRAVVSYVGACDPGAEAPSEFYWFTPSDSGVSAVPALAASTSGDPSARLVTPGRDQSGTNRSEMKYWR